MMAIKDKYIVVLGCFDTKGEDFSYLVNCIKAKGQQVITLDTGVMESKADFTIDVNNEQIANASGTSLVTIRKSGDRGKAVELMGKGAANVISDLVEKNKIKGVIGMGGGGGTFIALEAMQEVPMGIPKLCLSTLAAKDLSRQIGVKDITLMVSSVDVAGLNSVSKLLMNQAAAAICSMSEVLLETLDTSKKRIAISTFGNTTKCVDKCTQLLKSKGYEVLAFHATGIGGATMESLIREGIFDGVLDITTTELADELCGGVLSAGPARLTAASDMRIPQIVVPGCLDMVNFSHINTVPEAYKLRQLYSWSPDVTLMRTNKEENENLGELLGTKLNRAKAGVKVLIPLQGISQIDCKGGIFYNPAINEALFRAIKENTNNAIPIIEMDAHINDEAFANVLVEHLLSMIEQKNKG
jgi:uncharacterized protein (UPF0261 family)